jgi:hypothetical protein
LEGRCGIEKFCEWAQIEKLNTDSLKSVLFLPEERCGFSSWSYAIRGIHTDMVQNLWECAQEMQLTQDELKNKLLLAADRDGNSAIYWAACTGSVEVLETMWCLSKEMQLNLEELRVRLAYWCSTRVCRDIRKTGSGLEKCSRTQTG